MLKKPAFSARGFVSMPAIIILFILLVTYYFYQDKIKETSGQFIQNNRQSGTLFYVEGIWNKMKGIQKMQDDRTQSAYDLTSAAKTISEKTGLYSVDVPESWEVITEQQTVGKQLSKVTATSKAFSQRIVGGEIFYDNGAQLTVRVLNGEQADAKNPDGGHGKMLLNKESVVASGEDVVYHKILDPRVKVGDILDAHILHGGNTYEIRYVFNKEKLNGGEFLFQTIMNSFKFRDKK